MFFIDVEVRILKGFKLNLKGGLLVVSVVLNFVFWGGYEYSSISEYTDFVKEKLYCVLAF